MSKTIYKHVKTKGEYEIVCFANLESPVRPVVVYRNLVTQEVWVRPSEEFFDGRFRAVDAIEENDDFCPPDTGARQKI